MESTARWLGYGTAFALLALLLWLFNVLKDELSTPARLVQVRFEQIGTLRPEDPVTKQGVVIGRVHSVTPERQAALVTLELFNKDPLKADARFVNFNHSLMGDRMMVLVPGRSEALLDESRVQEGFFAEGVAETLHSVDKLLRMVFQYDSLSGVMRSPRHMQGSLSGLVDEKLFPIFDEIATLAGALEKTRSQIEPSLQSLDRSATQLHDLAQTVHGNADTLVRFAAASVARIDSLSVLGLGLVDEVDSLMQLAAGPNAALRPLLFERTVYERTLQLAEVLRMAIAVLQSDGLSIISARNLHFFRGRASDAEKR
jgi:ABC-type transporter Mla subunit MlaD